MASVHAIGVAVPDVSDFVDLEPAFGIGDQREQLLAALDAVRARGELPDDVELEVTFATFSAVDTESKRRAAADLAGSGVLAVLGARDFTYGAVRLAERFRVPVLDVNAVPTSLLSRTAPWMFTLRAAQDVLYRAFVRWAHREGLLASAAIGIFDDRFTRESAAAAVRELQHLGCEVAAHVRSDGAGVGSDQDESAAERFCHAGVDTVMPFVSGSSLIQLLRAMDDLGYRPRVVDLETGEHTTDVTAHFTPPRVYGGTRALTMNRVGEVATGGTLHPLAADVVRAFEERTGRRLDPAGWRSSGELTNLLMVHDLTALLAHGLRQAPRPLTRESLVTGLDRLQSVTLASGGDASFGPGQHWAIRQARPVQWSAEDDRWVAVGAFEELTSL